MDEDPDEYQDRVEMVLIREYADLSRIFRYVVTTSERTYLANEAHVKPQGGTGQFYFEVELVDAWVWDGSLPYRLIDRAVIYTFNDVNIEELKRESV